MLTPTYLREDGLYERDAERVADGHAGVAYEELCERESTRGGAPGLCALWTATARLQLQCVGREGRWPGAPRDAEHGSHPCQQESTPQKQCPAQRAKPQL